MTADEFSASLAEIADRGEVFTNPGGGTTTIQSVKDGVLRYQRGESEIPVRVDSLYRAYLEFMGKEVSTSGLKEFAPEVFDSDARPAGHNCNCTTLFLILQRLGLVEKIEGAGKSGDPFRVMIKPATPVAAKPS